MNRYVLLREYLRTCRRVKLKPSPEGFKKIAYLRFMNANVCPSCGEDVAEESYICVRGRDSQIVERYRCIHCGAGYLFPNEMVH